MLIPALILCASVRTYMPAPVELKTEYLVNPIGIDTSMPRLFWMESGLRKNWRQSAYRIVVASTVQKLLASDYDLWDSGQVRSDNSTHIEYAGSQLAPGQRAWWRVQVWDQNDVPSRPSSPAYWELGLPSKKDWNAQWISLPSTEQDPLKIPSPYLRKVFEVGPEILSARAYVSAKGLYELFIDGKRQGKDLLAPGWTDYRKRVQYQTFDMTDLLRKGSHVAGIRLGNGWYCGHVGLTGGGNYGKSPEAIFQLEITYRDGHHKQICSDGSWAGRSGSILSNDLLMGEYRDARKEPIGWDQPSFSAKDWQPVAAHGLDNTALVGQANPGVQELQEIKPIAVIPQKDHDVHVVDLGQNMVGWARLSVNGPAGTKVQLRFSEMLSPDKTVYTTNLRGARATDTYILRGEGKETFEPSFTAHGFRYVEIRGYPGEFKPSAVTGIVVGSNNPVTGKFACSSDLVNKLQHNIFWGERGNYLSIPTDCPQRDERLGWMGDAQIFVRTACFNNDVAPFMTKWTQDVVDAQSEQGGFSDVSPRMGDQSDGAPAWGDAGVIVPFTIYLCYGDKRLLEERYPAMQKWIQYIDSANPDHTWIQRTNNNFGDWLNVHDDTPRPVIATAYFAYSTSLLAESARILGKSEDAARYKALLAEIKKAFNDHFVSPEGVIQGDSQTDYVLALRFGLLPEQQRTLAAKRLVDHIVVDRKGHLSTGFVGVGYLNPTLTSIGRSDVAYQLLLNDTYPSWGYSIRQGATTIWERWDGWTQDKGFQDPGMNSFNHYSLGSVGEWMYKTVAGIDLDPSAPGYKRIIIHPIVGGGLTWAKAHLDSLYGKIESSWKLDGKRLTLEVTVPPNTTAKVVLPRSLSVMEDGKSATKNLLSSQGDDPSNVVFQVGSGVYHFAENLP